MTDRDTSAERAPERTTFVQRLIRIGSTRYHSGRRPVRAGPASCWRPFTSIRAAFGSTSLAPLPNPGGRFIEFLTHSVGWAIEYFLLGAILVIPIWIVVRVLGSLA